MYTHLGTRMGMRHHGWFSGGNDPSKGLRRPVGGHCRKVSALHTAYEDVENNTYLFSIRQVKNFNFVTLNLNHKYQHELNC